MLPWPTFVIDTCSPCALHQMVIKLSQFLNDFLYISASVSLSIQPVTAAYLICCCIPPVSLLTSQTTRNCDDHVAMHMAVLKCNIAILTLTRGCVRHAAGIAIENTSSSKVFCRLLNTFHKTAYDLVVWFTTRLHSVC